MNLIAITNSRFSGCVWPFRAALWAIFLHFFIHNCPAETNSVSDRKSFIVFAEKTLLAARANHHRAPTNAEATWQLGRACFDRAEFATDDSERAKLAVEGIEVMRKLVVTKPDLAAAHFYLAMNLGQLARTKLLGALTLVDEMEKEFKLARQLDEHFEFAGPDRNLGQLYLQAPGWPASIGNRFKARKHLERAVELAPGFPENHLNLLEAFCEWKDQKGIRRELKVLDEIWSAARTNFTGEVWASYWADWEKRRAHLQTSAAAKLAR